MIKNKFQRTCGDDLSSLNSLRIELIDVKGQHVPPFTFATSTFDPREAGIQF